MQNVKHAISMNDMMAFGEQQLSANAMTASLDDEALLARLDTMEGILRTTVARDLFLVCSRPPLYAFHPTPASVTDMGHTTQPTAPCQAPLQR